MDADLKKEIAELAERLDRNTPVWDVYRLTNQTRKEVFYGVTKDSAGNVREHAVGGTEAIDHWDFATDDILPRMVRGRLTQRDACNLASSLERSDHSDLPGHKVIRGTEG